ncbi:A/G-specific adenine glycosylase [Brachybacterium sp. p3-SID1565]|uniref:A/G-specific adenine glycosylase n=1 Tax=Brachybacterium TaxID=43668 RepID=UPI0021A36D17|nr:A/G-specific adenine glycosylase [Brachybacterium sp. p3-SID1565]MCT1384422.1 A/G-specific adenine glycosylase [Brachybacterium sp. p3-SID1565]
MPLDAHAVTAVIAWFADAGRDLPWRSPGASAWSILVSEVMLQQTPVVRVLPRWLDWMDRWPAPADLASAPTAEVLRAWDRLGYPRRALRLQQCARAIVDEHDGEVPRGEEALRALPGIGEYTAAAVTAFAHHDRAVVLDTNVRRVLARTMAGAALPPRSLTVAERRTATQVLPEEPERSVAWNQAVMELGALVCTAGAPRCEQCPLAGPACAWYSAGRPPAAEGSRRVQAFAGTDRQLRGQIMALLRTQDRATEQALLELDPGDEQRVQRCRASLVADGLAVPDGAGLRLP